MGTSGEAASSLDCVYLLHHSNRMGKYSVASGSERRMMGFGPICVDRAGNKEDMHMRTCSRLFRKFGAIATVVTGVLLVSPAPAAADEP